LQIASGYADGSVRIWDREKGTCETTLNGHKGAVTALRYNKSGSLLASGSKDNDIILWDVVGETGLYRLRGHRDQVFIITACSLNSYIETVTGLSIFAYLFLLSSFIYLVLGIKYDYCLFASFIVGH
jgi:WD40 repeat protein